MAEPGSGQPGAEGAPEGAGLWADIRTRLSSRPGRSCPRGPARRCLCAAGSYLLFSPHRTPAQCLNPSETGGAEGPRKPSTLLTLKP